eukprot:760061-Hanusia_phi.AAC.1
MDILRRGGGGGARAEGGGGERSCSMPSVTRATGFLARARRRGGGGGGGQGGRKGGFDALGPRAVRLYLRDREEGEGRSREAPASTAQGPGEGEGQQGRSQETTGGREESLRKTFFSLPSSISGALDRGASLGMKFLDALPDD